MMRFFHLKRPRSLKNRSQLYPVYGAVGLVLLLCVALGVLGFLRARESQRANLAEQQLRDGIQSELTMVLRTYDQMSLPRADLSGKLLPEMGRHLYSAYSLNTILTDIYGKSASILDNEFYMQITEAIDSMHSNLSAGNQVDITTSALGSYMIEMQGVLAQHFGDATSLMA